VSRTSEVIKNKNKIEKARKARRKNEMVALKNKSAFKARLYDELKKVDIILNDKDIDAVVVTVPEKSISQFTTAIYSEDLVGYTVEQVPQHPNQFYLRRKYISF
jgi:hypothetical protein